MAVYKLFPEKDASIFSAYPAMNTVLDAILDVNNQVTQSNPVARVARSLIKFSNSEINNVINTIAPGYITGSNWRGTTSGSQAGGNWAAELKAYVAKASNVIINSYVEVWPISGSWNNGTGQYLDNKVNGTNGVSWVYADYSGSSAWVIAGFPPLLTGSYSGSNNAGGGNWYTGSGGYTNVNSITQS